MIKYINLLCLVFILSQMQTISCTLRRAHRHHPKIRFDRKVSKSFSFWDIVQPMQEFPERVRTVEEYNARKDEYVVFDFIGLVERHKGYKAEEYEVVTDDGYILKLHRITGSPRWTNTPNRKKPVVYIQHGLFGSSDIMVALGPEHSLALLLADTGYDVWLGNVRGNSYSRAHTIYSPDHNVKKFWNFSMDEIAKYDVPKLIDFVLEHTDQGSLTYIGFSMGTTLSYMLLSEKPEYNSKINLLISLAPEVFFSGTGLTFKTTMELFLKESTLFGKYELLPQSVDMQRWARTFCSSGNRILNSCSYAFSLFSSVSKMNLTAIPEILSYVPSGTSYYVLQHFKQLTKVNRKLQKYVHTEECMIPSPLCWISYNRAVQNADQYDISRVTVPIAIYYGQNDVYAKVSDVEYLNRQLKNVIAFEKVADPNFNHFDFLWHMDAKTLVYDRVIEITNKYKRETVYGEEENYIW